MNFEPPLPGSGDVGRVFQIGNEIIFDELRNSAWHLLHNGRRYLDIAKKRRKNRMLLLKALEELTCSNEITAPSVPHVIDITM